MKIFLGKILNILTLLILFLLFFIGYFYSLVIIKPRDITFLARQAFTQIENLDERFNINAESVILEWNAKNFTFDLKLQNSRVKFNSHEFTIPLINLDLSKRNLLLGKFKIDQLIIPRINYINSSKISQDLALDELYFNLFAGLEYIAKNILEINHLAIEKINIYDEKSFKISTIQNLEFRLAEYKKQHSLLGKFKFNAHNLVSFGCKLSSNNFIEKCDIEISDMAIDFLKEKFDILADYRNKLDLVLSIRQEGANNYELILQSKLANLAKNTDDINFLFKALLSKNYVKFDDISVSKAAKKLYLEAHYDLISKHLSFQLSGEHLDKEEMFLLWPENIVQNTRNWLKKALIDTELENFALSADLAFTAKKILENFNANFKIKNSTLKVAANLGQIDKIDAEIAVTNRKLNILVNKGKIGEDEIKNVRIKINQFKTVGSKLYIDTDLNLSTVNLLNFLFAQNISQTKLDTLNSYFTPSKISGKLKLIYRIGTKKSLDDLAIDFKGNLVGSIKKFIKSGSDSAIILNKKLDYKNFSLFADLTKSEFYIQNLAAKKPIGDELNLRATIYKDEQNLNFNNISLLGSNVKLTGDIAIKEGVINKFVFKDVNFGPNLFSVDLVRNSEFLQGKFTAYNLVLTQDLFVEPASESTIKNFSLDYLLERVSVINLPAYFTLKGGMRCREFCDFIYGEANYSPESYIIYKVNMENNVKKLMVEANNIGNILSLNGWSNKLVNGKLRANGRYVKANNLELNVELKDFKFKQKNLLLKMVELGVLKQKNIEEIEFEAGEVDLLYKFNQPLEVKKSKFYGNLLGITAEGNIDYKNNNLNLEGYIIPAYKLNNLFGVKDIPVVGKILTGKDKMGLVSAKYNLQGELKEPKFTLYPLTALLPNAIKKIGDIFSRDFWLVKETKQD